MSQALADAMTSNCHTFSPTSDLPPGVEIIPLTSHADSRGEFVEIFRNAFKSDFAPCQWNLVRSEANVLRGVHVHVKHSDYLVLASGSCLFFLFDCRPGSPLRFIPRSIEARGHAPFGLCIPPGVAHGFYFYEPSVHIYSVDRYWDTSDELGVKFDDPGLKFVWPSSSPVLSERDQNLCNLESLLKQLNSISIRNAE
jgi:dTDP-4-dehydrorhamnose 3,5-epimerase